MTYGLGPCPNRRWAYSFGPCHRHHGAADGRFFRINPGRTCRKPDRDPAFPPCQPGKFIGLWNNYRAAAEKNGHAIPAAPLWFLKPDSSVVGHGATVTLPPHAGRVIYEGELGVVIGTPCRNASLAEAEAAIFGYTCINDLTSLDILNADPSFPQ